MNPRFIRILALLTNAFPVWVVLCSVLALFYPGWFTWFSGPLIVWGLGVIMLGMGMTLRFDDFQTVLRTPRVIGLGVACQFIIMPFMGWTVAYAMGLHRIDPALAVGLILVSCCPGGTASNVVAYLARANVALSVLMTMCSTFAAIVLTPWMTKWLAGTLVTVDAVALFKSTVQVVLLPVVAGITLNQYFPKTVKQVLPVSPLISVIAIVLIVASIIGANESTIRTAGWRLLAAPFVLHIGAFLLGYMVIRLAGYPEPVRRTISIEVGMQNSGLGTYLAKKHFPGTVAPVPCAISAVYHCVIGSLLAGLWRLFPASGLPESSRSR